MILPRIKPGQHPGIGGRARFGVKKELKAFPIWAVMLLMSIGMCFLALGGLAIYYDKSIWVILLCGLIALKAFNTPWIYNYFLRRLKEPEESRT
jgi:hypothetical protein